MICSLFSNLQRFTEFLHADIYIVNHMSTWRYQVKSKYLTEDVLRSPRISKKKPQTISYQFYSTNNYKNIWVISGQKAKPGNFYKLDLNETINVTKSSLHVSTPLGQSRICLFEVFLPDDKLFDEPFSDSYRFATSVLHFFQIIAGSFRPVHRNGGSNNFWSTHGNFVINSAVTRWGNLFIIHVIYITNQHMKIVSGRHLFNWKIVIEVFAILCTVKSYLTSCWISSLSGLMECSKYRQGCTWDSSCAFNLPV